MTKWRCGREECYRCLSGYRGKGAYKGHHGYRPEKRGNERMAKFLQAAPAANGKQTHGPAASDKELAKARPALLEYLTEQSWGDGKPRKTATLTIFAEQGLWKLCLSDRATDRTTWASGTSLDAAMDALEENLADGSAEWRHRSGGSNLRRG